MQRFLHLSTLLLKSRRWIITFNYEIDYADTHDIAIIDNPDSSSLLVRRTGFPSSLNRDLLDRSISTTILIIKIVQIFKSTFKNSINWDVVGNELLIESVIYRELEISFVTFYRKHFSFNSDEVNKKRKKESKNERSILYNALIIPVSDFIRAHIVTTITLLWMDKINEASIKIKTNSFYTAFA